MTENDIDKVAAAWAHKHIARHTHSIDQYVLAVESYTAGALAHQGKAGAPELVINPKAGGTHCGMGHKVETILGTVFLALAECQHEHDAIAIRDALLHMAAHKKDETPRA